MTGPGDLTTDRLVNWARWARDRGGRSAHCYSAEGRYRPEKLRGDTEEERRTPLAPIDVRDAMHVYRAIMVQNGFPKRMYLVLTAEFVLRLEVRQFQGYLRRHGHGGVSSRDLEQLVVDAVHAAGNAIRRADDRAALALGPAQPYDRAQT